MIRILQCVNNMHRAGLETLLMNYYRHIDRTKIQFDFLTHRPSPSDYDEEIKELGGRVYYAPRLYPQNYPAYFRYMKEFFGQHPEYKIMHAHIDSMSYLPLLAGKCAGVPIRIAHSHNTGMDKDFKYPLKQLFRSQINHVANVRYACGEEAGKFLFGHRKFHVVANAIDSQAFFYDRSIRNRKRQEMNLHNHFVVGHVGRLSYQKNHAFLVDIFYEIIRKRQDSLLLLVGAGEKEEEIRKKVALLGLEDQVIFLGKREDVSEIYQAMDAFVLPSLFEGLPLVGLEAQFAGLPCFFSDRVPAEAGIGDNAHFIPLEKESAFWADQILKNGTQKVREIDLNEGNYSNFDITKAARILEKRYVALSKYAEQLR